MFRSYTQFVLDESLMDAMNFHEENETLIENRGQIEENQFLQPRLIIHTETNFSAIKKKLHPSEKKG